MAEKAKSKFKVPKFKNNEEEAEFWDSHSPLDYDLEEVKIEFRRHLKHVLEVEMDASTLDALGTAARTKGIGISALVRTWLIERLENEDNDQASSRSSAKGARN